MTAIYGGLNGCLQHFILMILDGVFCMSYRTRINWTAQQRSEMWDRWQRGESMSSIGRLFDRDSSSVFAVLSPSGGIRPKPRKRAALSLSLSERETISRGIVRGLSMRAIARDLNRSPSTISREIGRHGGRQGYRASEADAAAWERAKRPKRCKLARYPRLRRSVIRLLQGKWSPEQIAGWHQRHYAGDMTMQISHETIYKSLFIQARGVLKKELQQCLRSKRALRRSRHASLKQDGLGQITDMVSIRQRPAAVEDRAVPGHWEGDLLAGSNNSYIATLVERFSRYVMLAKVNGKDTETVINALIKHAHKLPTELYKSLTWDRGKEMADHQRFTLATDIKVYFCDPQSPW